ncbi:hypothetical protein SBRCBS47491_010262, partial [Sporothrix bragantina]
MKICGMQDRHARALTTALAIVYEADLDTGKAVDIILYRLFCTITSQALCAVRAATPPPPPPPTTETTTTAETTTTTTVAASPRPTYASRVAHQTTPLQKQTNRSPSNASPAPVTKPPPRDEVILHTGGMTSPPSNETIINAVKAAAGKRVQAVA